MLPVIKCESGFKQFDSKGKVLISKTGDVGITQINHVWFKEAKSLGLNLNDPYQNVDMAKVILQKQGKSAWVCYNKQKVS